MFFDYPTLEVMLSSTSIKEAVAWTNRYPPLFCYSWNKLYSYLSADSFLKDESGPWYFFRRYTVGFAEVIKVVVGYHLTETFVLFEESVDFALVSVFVDSIITIVLFHTVDKSEQHIDLFFVLYFVLFGWGQVNLVHLDDYFIALVWNIIIFITDSY